MREREYVEWLRGMLPSDGTGDDAAVIRAGSEELVFTTDLLVEGVHFDGEAPPRLIGRKAVAASLSDIAAMGAAPLCAVVSVCLPRGRGDGFSKEILLGAVAVANEFGLEIVGGDTTSSESFCCVNVAALGRSPEGGAVTRAGARDGDAILVTGELGGSMLGRHLEFVPRVREAERILSAARPSAMIDISDGLSVDLGHIAEESGTGAVIFEGTVPVSAEARELSGRDGKPALEHALGDGEDYELLLTAGEKEAGTILGLGLDCGVTRIGVIGGDGLRIRGADGSERNLEIAGYEHIW